MSLLIVAPLGLFYIGCKRCHHQAAETKKNPEAEQVEDPDQSGSSFQERENSSQSNSFEPTDGSKVENVLSQTPQK